MISPSQYLIRFLDLVLTDPNSLIRHKLARLLPRHWLDWALWYARNRNIVAMSHSQCAQDLFSLFILETRFGLDVRTYQGTFVEFGGFDGITHSNTYGLEQLGWCGIVLEPDGARSAECRSNRKCEVLHAAVVGNDGPERVEFIGDPYNGELSHISGYGTTRSKGVNVTEQVVTISLDSILKKLGSVDFLSIDTEGSEADILEASELPVPPRIIVVEHNYDAIKRNRIRFRLETLGYTLIRRSGDYFDDYYAK